MWIHRAICQATPPSFAEQFHTVMAKERRDVEASHFGTLEGAVGFLAKMPGPGVCLRREKRPPHGSSFQGTAPRSVPHPWPTPIQHLPRSLVGEEVLGEPLALAPEAARPLGRGCRAVPRESEGPSLHTRTLPSHSLGGNEDRHRTRVRGSAPPPLTLALLW